MADTTKILPKLRFPEFANDGEWEKVKLGEVVTFCNSKCNRSELRIDTYISTENIRQDFLGIKRAVNLPQNGSFTKFRIGDILVSNIRPYLKKIWQANFDGAASNDVLVFRTKNQNYDEYVAHLIKSDAFVNYCMEGAKGVKMPRGDKSTMLEYSIPLPSLPEQQKIASLLTSLDEQISANTKKLEALKAHKKSLMQQLFPANGEKTPKLRFPEFKNTGEWKVVKLGEIAKRITLKNKDKKSLPVLTNSASGGIVKQEDYFDREIVSKDNLINYYIVSDDDFVYNPRISTIAPVGPISRNKIGEGVMSPLYTVFRFVEGDVDFFEHYFKTNNWHQYLKDKANFGARFDRMNISTEDFMGLPIPFPPLTEQQKIASFLSSLDDIIQAQDNKIQKLETYKNGLMQQLFANTIDCQPTY
ncbi:MAG: restriction endonuclease subunit S [Bacteroidaceae bacterium]|nr:restriction endonuclease subunit S [Bacteroidaceae bacterium]